jgi:hypothetical protein
LGVELPMEARSKVMNTPDMSYRYPSHAACISVALNNIPLLSVVTRETQCGGRLVNDDIQSTEAVSFMARDTDLHMTDGRELWNYR